MLSIEIPGREDLQLDHLVCDFNGTLALDGQVMPGVEEQIAALAASLSIHILTAGTHGNLDEAQARMLAACAAHDRPDPQWRLIATGANKEAYVTVLGARRVVAIGNGANDERMLRVAGLSIAVLGGEGCNVQTLLAAEVVAASPTEALDLLLHSARLVATLRP